MLSFPAFRSKLLAWVVPLVLTAFACAHTQTASSTKPAATEPRSEVQTPGLFLYEVEREGKVSHLMGTIHLGYGFDEVLTDDARARFEDSVRVMTETDAGPDVGPRLLSAALLPEGKSLRAMLEPEQWQELKRRVGDQLPEQVLDRMKPWMPAVLLGLVELQETLQKIKPGAPMRMMDQELTDEARRKHKPVLHFETIDEQIAIFDAISLDEQVAELSRGLSVDSVAQSRALITAFGAGDERGLYTALFDAAQMSQSPGFYEKVLFERNERWMPTLRSELSKGGVFVAVGAAHLLGEKGLLAELAADGYRVRRVGE